MSEHPARLTLLKDLEHWYNSVKDKKELSELDRLTSLIMKARLEIQELWSSTIAENWVPLDEVSLIQNVATQILPQDNTRYDFTIVNTGSTTCYISNTENNLLQGTRMLTMIAGSTYNFKAKGPCWAICTAGTTTLDISTTNFETNTITFLKDRTVNGDKVEDNTEDTRLRLLKG